MIRAIINRLKKNEKGFTLIELMVVVAIIGILAAGIIPQFMTATSKAKTSASKADMANFATVLEIIYAEDGKYPNSTEKFQTMKDDGYIKDATPVDPWGPDYNYYSDSSGSYYRITDSKGNEVKSN